MGIALWGRAGGVLLLMSGSGGVGALYWLGSPGGANETNAAATEAVLEWRPSPSSNVAGYYVCYGFANGQGTNRLDVGNVTNVSVGLTANLTYYFSVVAYSGAGEMSLPSPEVDYRAPGLSSQIDPSLSVAESGTALRLSFPGQAGLSYRVETSEDLRQWVTLWTTNCLADGPVVFQNLPSAGPGGRFYRVGN